MEYREPYDLSLALEGPSCLQAPPIYQQEQHLSHRPNSEVAMVLLHEVMSPGIMVCVTLIFEAFEYVH
jgi:hypothetical protein